MLKDMLKNGDFEGQDELVNELEGFITAASRTATG